MINNILTNKKVEMKKLVLGGFLIASIMMLTSCLDGDNNNRTEGTILGVVGTHETTFRNVLYTGDYVLPYYTGDFASKINPGECYMLHVIMRGEDNPDPFTAGYYNVTVSNYERVETTLSKSTLTDTTTILTDEMATINMGVNNYAKGHLFISSYHDNVGDKQENLYDLSYNVDQTPVEENGKSVYNLFYRVAKTKEGSSPTGKFETMRAFQRVNWLFDHVANTEKGKGKEKYYFKINYIKSFNKDSVPTWGTTEVYEMPIVKDEK